MSVLWLAMTILQTFVERGVYVRQGSIETVKFASSQGVVNVEVSIVQGLVKQFSQSMFWLWSEQGGPATCSEHVNVLPDAGSNMTRQQSLSFLSMPAQTETEEHVRGKKALKKHLRRSIDKLVAAKEQLPEEEWREVAQGITDRIKGLQLQKDGSCSQEKGLCATRGIGEDTRIQAQSPTAGTGGFGRSESKTCCCARGMCKLGAGNRRGGRPRRRTRTTQGILTEIGTTRPTVLHSQES